MKGVTLVQIGIYVNTKLERVFWLERPGGWCFYAIHGVLTARWLPRLPWLRSTPASGYARDTRSICCISSVSYVDFHIPGCPWGKWYSGQYLNLKCCVKGVWLGMKKST